MKKLMIMCLMIGSLSLRLWAAPTTIAIGPLNEKTQKKTTMRVAYIHWASDFNDCNALAVGDLYGRLMTYRVKAAGADISYKVRFLVDPPEVSETESAVLYLIRTQDCNTTDSNSYEGVFYAPDANYAGRPIGAKFYIGIEDANEPNEADPRITDLKVWVLYDEGAPYK